MISSYISYQVCELFNGANSAIFFFFQKEFIISFLSVKTQ